MDKGGGSGKDAGHAHVNVDGTITFTADLAGGGFAGASAEIHSTGVCWNRLS